MTSPRYSSRKPDLLFGNLSFGESPRWHKGRFWVADWGTQEIISLNPDGSTETVVRLNLPTFAAICMDWLPDGRMLIVSSKEGVLLAREVDESLTTYADLNHLSNKGWNEIVVDGRGNTYVNGGGFDFAAGEPFAPGIIALVKPDGTAQQVADEIAFPNGMTITPDNKTLIIAESYANQLSAFNIAPDGTLSDRRVWAALGEGVPDGICIDEQGAVWYADVPNRRCVRVSEDGEVFDTVDLDRGGFACMLGGPDRKTLFIVAREWAGMDETSDEQRTGQVLTLQVDVAGTGWP